MPINTIPADKDKALKIYKKADATGKALLVELLGDTFFRPITERVKSFEDACELLGADPDVVLVSSDIATADEIAYIKLKIIAQALNEGWKPNWSNSNESKYFPWFDMSDGFSFFGAGYYSGPSDVGSRLCFKSRDLAEYAGKQFLHLYKSFFTY